MSFIADEVRRQPDAWARVLDGAAGWSEALPSPGERVAVIGCGTSWFMAEAYAALREDAGLGETDFFTASRLPKDRAYDRVVAITRSGTTTEVIDALGWSTARRTVLTAVPDSPVAEVADHVVDLGFADEQSVVQTLFATTTLMLLRASLGEELGEVVRQARDVLAGPDDVPAAEQYSFLGSGWAHGIAREAALKLREAAQAWTESYPQLEYRHGPIAIAEPGRVVWVFGTPEPGLVDDVEATGATVVNADLDPVADLVRLHRLASRLAAARGLDPDRPRHLTRSVVLR
jgi:fructoselysine-6-P-deglycase FrlB-like protein